MPGVPERKNNQVAIPAVDNSQNAENVPQPRQPQNLQSLLRFAMEAQQGPANPEAQPLDQGRMQFLENALKEMTVDVIALMNKQIEILQNVENITEDEVPAKIEALETILEYISNIDLANDFHKINGFSIFDSCLRCKYAEIRAETCNLIAELAQNNPYIQNVVCETTNLMPTLLKLLESDLSEKVHIKSIYAISCITRDSDLGYKNFKHHDGISTLKLALTRQNDKLETKITFLLSALHRLDSDLIKILISVNFVPLLLQLIKGSWRSSHEHVLSLLHLMIESEEQLRIDLQDSKFELKKSIVAHLDKIRGREECREEEFYCEQILKLVFPAEETV